MEASAVRRAIEGKRDGARLEAAAWQSLIGGYVAGSIDDAQMAALAMACVWRGLDPEETYHLTAAMVESGDVLELGFEAIDKHSSGGVGDTVSLVVVPIAAACGVRVAKLSGRALGHTGGTLDKLEAIPGVRTDLAPERFLQIVRDVGCAIAAQSDRLVPADKKLYALRDRTGTVRSIGLIAASIVSKKIAGGAQGIVFDVKCGNGAFMRDAGEALELASALVDLAKRFGRRAIALVTDMDEPLGQAIGSGIEAVEARAFLRGERRDSRFTVLVESIASAMLDLGGVTSARAAIRASLENGTAYEAFVNMLEAQGGTRAAFESIDALPGQEVVAERAGYVARIDTVRLGEIARDLVGAHGAFAGIRLRVRVGDAVRKNEPLAEVCGESEAARHAVVKAIAITGDQPGTRPLVIGSTRTSSPSRITSATR